jgi:hypothetical protein
MIRYFISYLFQGPYGVASGSGQFNWPTPIATMDDVNTIVELLRQQGLKNPTVMSFCRFDGDAADGGPTR